ncbi:MAG: Hsp70 family protein, partial [Candidatus Bathyarchaeia archaeon]
ITITASTKLSKEEKERMIREAEQFAEQDRRAKEEAETLNAADSLIYTAEKTLKELGDKLSKEHKDRVEKAAAELKEALGSKQIDRVKQRMDELTRVLQEAGASVYQQQAGRGGTARPGATSPPGGEEKPPPGGRDKVVDADYKVVDEDKK